MNKAHQEVRVHVASGVKQSILPIKGKSVSLRSVTYFDNVKLVSTLDCIKSPCNFYYAINFMCNNLYYLRKCQPKNLN
jgi:hypothetical protein